VGNMLRRVGYQAVRTDMLLHLGLCLHLGKLFESQRIDTVWDVGANRGQFYRLLRKGMGFKGTILSFEPLSELHKLLAEKSKNDRNWHVFPFALGEKQEQLAINIMKANDMSSFLMPDQDHTDRFRDSNTPIKTELVNIKCLDDIFEELRERYHIERSYLKMDTQGYDLNVVKGGKKVISNFVGLQTEASVLPVYKEMPDYRKAIHFMNEIGFELSGLFPVARDEKWRLIEFDCVMVNPEKIDLIPAEMH
jgi:FkbM family methyltransferase